MPRMAPPRASTRKLTKKPSFAGRTAAGLRGSEDAIGQLEVEAGEWTRSSVEAALVLVVFGGKLAEGAGVVLVMRLAMSSILQPLPVCPSSTSSSASASASNGLLPLDFRFFFFLSFLEAVGPLAVSEAVALLLLFEVGEEVFVVVALVLLLLGAPLPSPQHGLVQQVGQHRKPAAAEQHLLDLLLLVLPFLLPPPEPPPFSFVTLLPLLEDEAGEVTLLLPPFFFFLPFPVVSASASVLLTAAHILSYAIWTIGGGGVFQ